jgi:hypothetical protein
MSRQQGTGEWTGPQWEYKMVPIGYLQANRGRTLNELGREGWELIGAPPNLP